MSLIIDKAVQITANNLNKTLHQAIIDGDFSQGGGGGTGSGVEIFNNTVVLRGGETTVTGLNYFVAPSNITVSFVRLLLWEKSGITTGTLSIDLKKNTTPSSVGMTTIFTTQPSLDFAVNSDYSSSSGVLSSGTILAGEVIRLDITSVPSSWLGKFSVVVYA